MTRGVLLVNLGTPDAPTAGAIRRYLREFLSDRRVVELPRVLWLPVLYGFILPFRPAALAKKYRLIWTAEGSPLLAISRRQAQRLRDALPGWQVALAMRYGSRSIAEALRGLEERGVTRLVVLPLYPQYSGTTTASVLDAVAAELGRRDAPPELHTINQYYDHPAYIAALADSVRTHWRERGRGDYLLISFHSIPQRYVDNGDPYFEQCRQTAAGLAQALQLDPANWSVSFQSRLGRAPWLQPYTDLEVPRLAKAGVKTLDIICPGFSADCLETLEEVAIRYAQDFERAGGKKLRYIPALNDSPAHVDALAQIVEGNL